MPVSETAKADLSCMRDLIDSDGNTIMRHIFQCSVEITDCVCCSCLFGNFKNTCFLSKKFFICKGWICFIKCYMTINSNSTETDINAPQFFNQFRNIFRMIRIRKYSLIFRHYKFRANFIINCTLHEASEA